MPKEVKTKLPKVFKLLTSDPRHPSLQVKKIVGTTRTNVYECRLDQSWRIIVQQESDMTFDLLFVGAHDEAISYGARLHEERVPYGDAEVQANDKLEALDELQEKSVESYLLGNDKALEFVDVTFDDFEKLMKS